jgi:hypothetical protein
MSDTKERLQRARSQFPPPESVMESLRRRRDRKRRNQRIRAGVLGLAIAIAVGWLGVNAIRSTPPVPADDPTPTEGLGIFAPVAGRIVYGGGDAGDLWAVDPIVADDVASTLVRLPQEPLPPDWLTIPFGWSRDGTELLFMRTAGDCCYPETHIYILHADGSETRLDTDRMYFAERGDAAISPDGTRVVVSGWGDDSRLHVIDAEGGRAVPLPMESSGCQGCGPTFSPDGTQIAYLFAEDGPAGRHETQVWVMDVDGPSDAHEILTIEHDRFGPGVTGLQWSPAGDRLAIGLGAVNGDGLAIGGVSFSAASSIYTFAPDG